MVPSSCSALIRLTAKLLAARDLVGALERVLAAVHVPGPLPPPEHFERLERDVGRPVRHPGLLGDLQ